MFEVLGLTFSCQLDLLIRRFLSFLHKSMQQHDLLIHQNEEGAGNPVF
jgi:hypothetical protein